VHIAKAATPINTKTFIFGPEILPVESATIAYRAKTANSRDCFAISAQTKPTSFRGQHDWPSRDRSRLAAQERVRTTPARLNRAAT
jgi:hypothetical protein